MNRIRIALPGLRLSAIAQVFVLALAAGVLLPDLATAQVTPEQCKGDRFRILHWNDCLPLGVTGQLPPEVTVPEDFSSVAAGRPGDTIYVPHETPYAGPPQGYNNAVPPQEPPDYSDPSDAPLVDDRWDQISDLQYARDEVYNYILDLQDEVPLSHDHEQWLRDELQWAFWQLSDIDQRINRLYQSN